jgi:hypothetical protein
MEKENFNFYVDELAELRKLVNKLVQINFEYETEPKDLFIGQLQQLAISIRREIQFRQLHLDENAIYFMDRLQIELVQLSDDCHSFLYSDKKLQNSAEIKAYSILIQDTINGLLDHFKEQYSYCFNFKMVVPSRYKSKVDSSLVKVWEKANQALASVAVDEKLFKVLKDYNLEMKADKKATFHSLDLWTALAHELSRIEVGRVDEMELQLCRLLCYFNFNYPAILQYYVSKMQRDYDEIENYREEYIKITVELRTLRQFIVRSDFSYDVTVIPLKDALADILENELLCIKKLVNMNKKVFEGSGTKYFMQQFYFKISVSMEQFLFIFRLLIEQSIVIVKRKADLYEFIHTHVGTVKKNNLSIGNMQNTYAENNRITAIKVKAILQSLIKLIDEKYLSLSVITVIF